MQRWALPVLAPAPALPCPMLWRDRVVALFVEADAQQAALDVEALRAYLAARLEPYKVPRRIVLLPALPRTYNGKLDYKALRGNAQN